MANKKSGKKAVSKAKPRTPAAKAKLHTKKPAKLPQRSKKKTPARPARTTTKKPKKQTTARPAAAGTQDNKTDAQWFGRLRAEQEKRAAGFSDLNRQWTDMQNTWRDTMQAAGAGAQAGRPPFADIFTQMGQPFLNLMGSAAGMNEARMDTQDIVARWLDAQRGFWELLLLQTTQPAGDASAGWQAMAASMAKGAPAWAHMTAPAFPSFDMPGIGYTREKQEDWARLYRCWLAHEEALRHYNAEMVKVALIALSRFEETLKSGAGQPLSSLKDIYHRWVDVSEDVYARFAMTDDHAKIYARMVDTLSELKIETTKLCDQWAQQLNLPTRAEIDTLHRQMHDMKRDNRELKRLLAELAPRGRKGGAA